MTAFKKGRSAVSTVAAVSMFAIALIIGGGVTGLILNAHYQNQQQGVSSTTTTSQTTTGGAVSSGPFAITLVITGNAAWNSTTTGPRYWVLTPSGLDSSANISLPAHTLIQLTIIDYDTPTPLPSQFAAVSGTVGNVVYVVNGTTASGGTMPFGGDANLTSATAVSSLDPNSEIAHTFTVAAIGLNIPVAANSVEVANFYVNQAGTFTWRCEAPCGFGSTGYAGPMSTVGWMTGTIIVN